MQAGRGFHDSSCTVVILTGDLDLIAYGNKIVVVVKSWFKETYRYFDMRLPVTEEAKQKHPLYNYYHSYGVEVIHWWAAVMGCDISLGPTKTGIKDAGAAAFLSAMQAFDGSTNRPNVNSFARALLQACSKKVTDVYSLDGVVGELIRVSNWFGRGGQYYDKNGNIVSTSGVTLQAASRITCQHMMGELHPKTCDAFSVEEKTQIEAIQPHNLLHDTSTETSMQDTSLPQGKTSVKQCTANELKLILISKGASISKLGKGLTKQELEIAVTGHLMVDEENESHTVYFNPSRANNGSFATIDTSSRQTVPKIVDQLVAANEHEEGIMAFSWDIQAMLRDQIRRRL